MKNKWIFCVIFLCVASFLVYISILKPLIPLTYDEAWNFTDLSRHGPVYAITRYPFPNNHVFFTALQSIFTPTILLSRIPYALRFVNVVICFILFHFLFLFLNKTFHKRIRYSLFALISFFFASPLLTPYFIVSRGYVLGSLLLFTGIYLLAQKKYAFAIIPFALSVWTVPTFLYTLPLLYFVLLLFDKNHRLLIVLTGTAVVLTDFLLYFPILKNIFSETNFWTTYTFFTFFNDTIRSLSNYSFIPYGATANYLYIILYMGTFFLIYLREKRFLIKQFFVYLNTALLSYLLIIWVLSQFHVAQPPFMRNGLFIPMIVVVTASYGITFIGARYRWAAWSIFIGNALVGGYLFTTMLPYSPTKPYPHITGLSPQVMPQQELRNEIQKGTIISHESNDNVILKYYSILYKVPLINFNPSIATPTATAPVINKQVLPAVVRPTITPYLLPDNPLYAIKRIWQKFRLKSYDVFVLSKKPKIRYLLSLSDETYRESFIMWNKEKRAVAMKTISRAENFVTLITPEVHTLSNYGDTDKKLYEELKSSIDQHLQKISGLLPSSTESEKQTLLLVQGIAIDNLKTLTFLMGR